jgi:MFS superfamily sulfate permease-like transporter
MNTLLHHLSQNTARGEAIPAAEAFVLLTLGFFLGMVAAVALSAWVLYRRSAKPEPHRRLLLEMEEREQHTELSRSEPPQADQQQAWEQDPDWWKKQGGR